MQPNYQKIHIMKKIFAFAICILFCFPVLTSAQDLSKQDQLKPDKHSKLHHDLGLTAGPGSAVGGLLFGILGVTDALVSGIKDETSELHPYGHYGLHYYANLAWWCQLGGKLCVEGTRNTHYADKSKSVVTSTTYYALASFMPSIRFTYLNRKWIRLYSGVDLGCSYFFTHERDGNGLEKATGGQFLFAFDVTPLGISIGNKFFIMAETNLGTDSFVKVGIGGRF